MKNVALYSLGCKVNSYETEGMRQALLDEGYHIVAFDEKADIYIVNTCTVTNIADRKSRQMLHRAKQLNPDAVVVAVGCYVQTGRETIEKDDSIDLAVGNNRKKDIAAILEEFLKTREGSKKRQQQILDTDRCTEKPEREPISAGQDHRRGPMPALQDKTLGGTTVIDIHHTREYEEMQVRQAGEHTRAYIKIQDGCNQFCAYCAIPYARGRVRSRRQEDILEEVRGLVKAGYREMVLTGIHISSYGIDFSGSVGGNPEGGSAGRLLGLIERIHEIQGVDRIRLGSLEPRIIAEETARRLSELPKLCPHFHLSLQSGCDDTLRRMNRHYTTGEYYESVESLRKYFDNPAITTDVIVGFPGETEEEFACTRAFLEKMGFYEMHIFKYSRRTGTAADRMPGQVPDSVKARRSGELLELEKRLSREFRKNYIGKEAEVLLEERQEIRGCCFWVGHTKDYVKVAVREKEDSERASKGNVKVDSAGYSKEKPEAYPEGYSKGKLEENSYVRVQIKGFLTDEILC